MATVGHRKRMPAVGDPKRSSGKKSAVVPDMVVCSAGLPNRKGRAGIGPWTTPEIGGFPGSGDLVKPVGKIACILQMRIPCSRWLFEKLLNRLAIRGVPIEPICQTAAYSLVKQSALHQTSADFSRLAKRVP